VPVYALLLIGNEEYAMFDDLRDYDNMLPVARHSTLDEVSLQLGNVIRTRGSDFRNSVKEERVKRRVVGP
jgi:hypothetical protein